MCVRKKAKNICETQSFKRQRSNVLETLVTTSYERSERIMTLLLTQPTVAKRSRVPKTDLWRTPAINFYGAGIAGTEKTMDIKENMRFGRTWCPIWQREITRETITAAHIIPQALSTRVISYMLGDQCEEEDLWSVRNCLPVFHVLERGTDKGFFVILPVEATETLAVTDYQCRLVDESVRDDLIAGDKTTSGDLDNRKLIFRNGNRHAKRYLYLPFVMSILTARELKWKGWNSAWKLRI